MSDELRILALFMILIAVFPVVAAGVLLPSAWSRNIALRERVGIALRDALVAVIIAILIANAAYDLSVNDGLLMALRVFAIFAISVPSAIWLFIYARGGFA